MSKQLHLAKLRAAQGDPGILGGLAKLAGKALKTFGGPVGTVAGLAVPATTKFFGLGKPKPAAQPTFIAPKAVPLPAGMPMAQQQTLTQAGIIGPMAAGGKALVKSAGKALASPTGQKIAKAVGIGSTAIGAYEIGKGLFGGGDGTGLMASGYHYNKALRRYQIAEAQGRDVQDPREEPRVVNEIVRNRSMNPLNPRALTRSFARVKAAQRWARRLVTFKKKTTITRRRK